MSEWREEGVVQDSDEDEDLTLDLNTASADTRCGVLTPESRPVIASTSRDTLQTSHRDAVNFPEHTHKESEPNVSSKQATKVEIALSGVEHTGQSGAAIASPQELEPRSTDIGVSVSLADSIWDIPSSPLSDLPESPIVPEASLTNPQTLVPFVALPQSWSSLAGTQSSSQHLQEQQDVKQMPVDNQYNRTFRKRNPIQLHPYLLENELYRNTLRSRGVRPVHVAASAIQEETQAFESQALPPTSSPSQSQTQSQPSPAPLGNSSPRPEQLSPASSQTSASDEFPDLAVLLRQPASDHLRVGYKKRRLKSSRSEGPAASTSQAAISKDLAASVREKHPLPRLKVPARVEGAALIATHTAAETKLQPINTQSPVRPITDSDTEAQTPSEASAFERAPAARAPRSHYINSSSDEEDSQSHFIQRQQRRMRGVLPASWLKLDLAAKSASSQQAKNVDRNAPSSPKAHQHKGLARRIQRHDSMKSSEAPSNSRNALAVPSDSEDEDLANATMTDHQTTRDTSTLSTRDPGISMKDNSIDYMASYSTAAKPRNRKRQMRLTDAFASAKRARVTGLQKPIRKHASRNDRAQGRKTISLSRPAQQQLPHYTSTRRLGILDLPHSSLSQVPHFVKVARRHVRQRKDQGRQSPNRKILSMHNQQDGADVDEVLRDWHTGRIKPLRSWPAQRDDHHDRPPLADVNENAQNGRTSKEHGSLNKSNRTGTVDVGTAKHQRNLLRSPSIQFRLEESFHASLPDIPVPMGSDQPDNALKTVFAKRLKPRAKAVTRQGQLEVLEDKRDAGRRAAFHRNLLELGGLPREGEEEGSDPVPSAVATARIRTLPTKSDLRLPTVTCPVQKARTKKRAPRHVDLQQLEAHQSARFFITPDELSVAVSPSTPVEPPNIIKGLVDDSTRRTIDFGIGPLPLGISFRAESFLGKGGLQAAFEVGQRDLDASQTGHAMSFGSHRCSMGCWTEEAADIFRQSLESTASSNVDFQVPACHASLETTRVIEQLTHYIGKGLSFMDPIDRTPFLASILSIICDCTRKFPLHVAEDDKERDGRLQLHTRLVVLAAQLRHVAKDLTVDATMRARCDEQLRLLASATAHDLIRRRKSLLDFHRRENVQLVQQYGINSSNVAVEAIAILSNVFRWIALTSQSFWAVMNEAMSSILVLSTADINPMEDFWQSSLAIVAIQEINADGFLSPGSRFSLGTCHPDDFDLAKSAAQQTFDLYNEANSPLAFNEYIRVILSRCHRLVYTWGWYRCEPILNTCFDFFARRGLCLLHNEEASGSCTFLENLDASQAPAVEPSDRSFHIFLKLLANGLTRLRQIHPAKKMRNIAFRFMPNHGRMLYKNDDLKSEDLDALRNNHDLLCVLYACCPPLARPSLQKVRDLVNFQHSHTEVCRLNVRAWANLLRFQISTEEPCSAAEPFTVWFEDMMDGCIAQYRAARVEAENFVQAKLDQGQIVSKSLVDATVLSNQREIESVIQTALGSLAAVLRHARSSTCAKRVFEGCAVSRIFQLHSDMTTAQSKTLIEALGAYGAYLDGFWNHPASSQALNNNEDSQDYGEWPSDDDLLPSTSQVTGTDIGLERVADDLQTWLSNAFGADNAPNESLLKRTVTVAASAAALMVQRRRKDWSSYLDAHGRYSWSQLRDTAQSRRFAPLFLGAVLEKDSTSFAQHRETFISRWLVCLVERESQLKYQHHLTAALLNAAGHEDLLDNLPFARSSRRGVYDISLEELRDRRLGLISSILSNIRIVHDRPATKGEERNELVQAVNQMMLAMKTQYREVQVSSNTRGAYVDFVQSVVQFLQQYTADICPIDRFFTDSTAFPLPAGDPLYIIGRLRAYHLRAGDISSQKKLAMFVQNSCERAAAEGQEVYLASQMLNATDGTNEQSGALGPSLRQLLLGSMFPAYVELAGTTSTGWIVSKPILIAACGMLSDCVFKMDMYCQQQCEAAAGYLRSILDVAKAALCSDKWQLRLMQRPEHALVLTLLFGVLTESLPLLDLLIREGTAISSAQETLSLYYSISQYLQGDQTLQTKAPTQPSSSRTEIQAFATRELRNTLSKNWSRNPDGSYSVLRGGVRSVVPVTIDSLAEECSRCVSAAIRYSRALGNMPALRRWAFGEGDMRRPALPTRNARVADCFV